jgi:hypothetical protein
VLQFTIPSGAFPGVSRSFFARFRIYRSTTSGAAQPTGYVVNGEVEDYLWSFSPTAITLRQLNINGEVDNSLMSLILVTAVLMLTTLLLFGRNWRKRRVFVENND